MVKAERVALILSVSVACILGWVVFSQFSTIRELKLRTEHHPQAVLQEKLRSIEGVNSAQLPKTILPQDSLAVDPRHIAELLRGAGCDEAVVASAVSAVVKIRNRDEKRRIVGADKQVRWKPGARISAEAAARLKEIERIEAEEIANIVALSSSKRQSTSDRTIGRFGAMQLEKTSAVESIERDYEEMRRRLAVSQGGGFSRIEPAVLAKLDSEMEDDIRRLLTPSEAEDYFRYASASARRLQNRLAGIDIDEGTYVALADRTFVAEKEMRSSTSNVNRLAELQQALYSEYAAILGAAQFLVVAQQLEPTASSADTVFAQIGYTPEQRVDVFLQANRVLSSVQSSRIQDHPGIATSGYAALVEKRALTSEQIEKFNKTRLGSTLIRLMGKP